ncbi:amidase [Caldimonas tepidiphila]|uniref:amidase n=1 Tax=Caldimonas tepidiphila TaxID=2315841 RepID=UPI000E5C42AB|nr:amidase [Caldimonas tepidiphila]
MNDRQPDASRRDFLRGAAAAGLATTLGATGTAARGAALPLPEYERFDATGLAQQIRKGQISALDALEAALARAEARSALNAIALRHDEPARDTARQLSGLGRAERERRAAAAPLLGVPFALKDLGLQMKGTVTTHGCAFFKDVVADHDSTLVQRYRAAGLNIFAKTTSPEFGQTATTESRLFGPTRNPWQPEHSSGGSSGGAAVAVASGILPVAHASDGGGSIRIPASHCGLFGLKPSRGRVPMGPTALEGWMGLSVHNVISRSVRDTALLLQLTQGPEPGSRSGPMQPASPEALMAAIARPPRPLRIALMEANPFGLPVHPDCLEAARKAARLCESLGHKVEPAALQLPVAEMFAGMGVLTATGMLSTVRAREKALGRRAREDEFEPLNWRSLQLASGYGAEQVFAARAVFDQVGRTLDLFFGEHDLILSPVTAAPAPKLGALSLDQPYEDFVKAAVMASPFTALFNMSGHPAMSVPLHWNGAGLPVGAQFAAPFGAEDRLLALAAQLEQAAPWSQRRPAPAL